jgi:hypothetical protein
MLQGIPFAVGKHCDGLPGTDRDTVLWHDNAAVSQAKNLRCMEHDTRVVNILDEGAADGDNDFLLLHPVGKTVQRGSPVHEVVEVGNACDSLSACCQWNAAVSV